MARAALLMRQTRLGCDDDPLNKISSLFLRARARAYCAAKPVV